MPVDGRRTVPYCTPFTPESSTHQELWIGIMGRMDGWLAGLVFFLSPFLFGTDRDGWVLVETGWDGRGYGELAEAKPKPT